MAIAFPTFAEAFRKLDRANAHLDALNMQIAAFLRPYAHTPVVQVEFDGTWYVGFHDPFPEPPEDLVLICGDFIYNLRATLDYAVNIAIRESGNKPRRAAFPICETEEHWCSSVVRPKPPRTSPLRGLDPKGEAWAIIREAQPYIRRKATDLPWLEFLGTLSNRDKHRALTVHETFPSPDAVESLFHWNPDASLVEKIDRPWGPLSRSERTELIRLRFDPDGTAPDVRVQGQFRVAPSFGNEEVQLPAPVLGLIRDRVTQTLLQLSTANYP